MPGSSSPVQAFQPQRRTTGNTLDPLVALPLPEDCIMLASNTLEVAPQGAAGHAKSRCNFSQHTGHAWLSWACLAQPGMLGSADGVGYPGLQELV